MSQNPLPPPAITIGLMTHNYARYLRGAIESVRMQTRGDWEMVISDDASTDNTPEVVKEFLDDPRITYVRHGENLGQAGNWAYVLEQGTASLLAVLHADDEWLPGALDLALAAFAANPALDLLYGNWQRRVEGSSERPLGHADKPHALTGHEEYRYLARRNTCLPSVAFLSRRVVALAGKPAPDLKMMVDQEYFLRLALHARQVQAVAEPLALYRVHAQGMTTQSAANGVFTRERERLADICARHVAGHPHLRASVRGLKRDQAKAIFSGGVTLALQGQDKDAKALLKRAVALDPGVLCSPKIWADWLLCGCGKPARALLRQLHRSRVEELAS